MYSKEGQLYLNSRSLTEEKCSHWEDMVFLAWWLLTRGGHNRKWRKRKEQFPKDSKRALFNKQHMEEGKVGVGRAEGALPPQDLQLGSEVHDGTAWSRRKQRGECNTQPQCVWRFCASSWEALIDNTTKSHMDYKTRKKHQCLPPHAQQIQVPHALPYQDS